MFDGMMDGEGMVGEELRAKVAEYERRIAELADNLRQMTDARNDAVRRIAELEENTEQAETIERLTKLVGKLIKELPSHEQVCSALHPKEPA